MLNCGLSLFQTRSQGVIKQLQDMHDQIEQARMELSTFKFLKEQEEAAVPRRLHVSFVIFKQQYYLIFPII